MYWGIVVDGTLNTPPEMPVFPCIARIPPPAMVRDCTERPDDGLIVTPPPLSRVRVLMLNVLVAGLEESWMLLLAARDPTVISDAFSGRRMAVVVVALADASPVAKDTPSPVSDVSTRAQGITPLLAVPVAPSCPMKARPVVVEAMVATPAPAAVPSWVPRNKTVPPVEPMVGAPNTMFAPCAGLAVMVMVDWPR